MAQVQKKPTISNTLDVTYQCQHISCRNPKCYKATLAIDQTKFEQLCTAVPEEKMFRSPSGYCRLGTAQSFEIINVDSNVTQPLSPKEKLLALDKQLAVKQTEQKTLQGEYQKKADKLNNEIKIITADIARTRALNTAQTKVEG